MKKDFSPEHGAQIRDENLERVSRFRRLRQKRSLGAAMPVLSGYRAGHSSWHDTHDPPWTEVLYDFKFPWVLRSPSLIIRK